MDTRLWGLLGFFAPTSALAMASRPRTLRKDHDTGQSVTFRGQG
jgi:hypothetical protein